MLTRGKVCVSTGAASPRGIGRATAHMLTSHGAHIVVIDIAENVNEAAEQIAADHPGTSTLGVRCNVASRAACV
jgi:NAD(P)-dependent dehydrogenase (short-subunit alcohol dehydrogenase family)